MSVKGEVCGHRDGTLDLGQPLSEDLLPNREQLVALSSPLRWQDFQMKPCVTRQSGGALSVENRTSKLRRLSSKDDLFPRWWMEA